MKPWYKSKTVWFNILTVGGAVATGVVGLLPTLAPPLMTPLAFSITTMVVGLVNVALRSITTDTLIFKDLPKDG